MKVFLNILVTALLMNMELICGNTGLALGLPLFGAVYFFIAFSPVHGITSAAFSALLLDAMYARNCLTWPLAAIVIVSLANISIFHQPAKKLLLQFCSHFTQAANLLCKGGI